jgi:hypothetical protein
MPITTSNQHPITTMISFILHFSCLFELLLSYANIVSSYPCSLPSATGSGPIAPCAPVAKNLPLPLSYSTNSPRPSNSSSNPLRPPTAGDTASEIILFNVLTILLAFSTLVVACLQYQKKNTAVSAPKRTEI